MSTDSTGLIESPVRAITGIWRFERKPRGQALARSLPGHLLHLVAQGAYRLRSNGREYDVRAGDLIYYHESEFVEWLGNVETVVFYSVGFLAPEWPPLPLDMRCFRSNESIRREFDELYRTASLPDAARRALRAHSALLRILAGIDAMRTEREPSPRRDDAWWRLEAMLRERRLFRPTLAELCAMGHRSRASVVRACRRATAASPMKRLRQVRMEEARALLKFSTLTVTQVSEYLGYPRVHEFSREFAAHFDMPPSRVRAQPA